MDWCVYKSMKKTWSWLFISANRSDRETTPLTSKPHPAPLQPSSQHANNKSSNCRTLRIKAQLIWHHSESFVERETGGTQGKHTQTWKPFTMYSIYSVVTCTDVNAVLTKWKDTIGACCLLLSSSCVTTEKGSTFVQLSRHFIISELSGSCTVQRVCEPHPTIFIFMMCFIMFRPLFCINCHRWRQMKRTMHGHSVKYLLSGTKSSREFCSLQLYGYITYTVCNLNTWLFTLKGQVGWPLRNKQAAFRPTWALCG